MLSVCAALAITACAGKPMASDSNATVEEEVNDSQEKRAAEIEEKSRTAYLRNPVRYCVNRNNGEVYFSYFSGVYRYNREEKKLEQIVDGEKQKLFKDMFGSIAVGVDGKIYMLGFIGGGDDEGPIDFLYMTPKE